jgi:hypothetical protein
MLSTFVDKLNSRWYYARGRIAEGDDVLSRLHDKPIEHPDIQETKREVFAAIAIELEANASIKWTQFLTFGIVSFLNKEPLP